MSEILDLSTKRERPQVKIDGVLYDLVVPTDLELRNVIWLQKASKRIDVLQAELAKGNESDAIGNEFEETMKKFSGLILGEVPEEVRDLLTDVQRMAIVDVYAKLIKEQQESFFDTGVAPVSEKAEKETGSTFSPSSSDSTEETSKAG